MRLEREARDLAAVWQSSRQLGQPLGEGGDSSGKNVEDMRHWLNRGVIQRQGCGPLKHIETRLLWLQAKHEERKVNGNQGTDANEHSRWIHESIADSSGSNVEDMRNWLRAPGAPVWNTKAQMWPRLVHADENSRNAMRHGLLTVPESLPRQKGNSACRELQMNRLLKGEHVTKSHAYRINRGVRGALWRKVVQNFICSDQWRARRFLSLRWISATCSKTPNGDTSLVIRHGPQLL